MGIDTLIANSLVIIILIIIEIKTTSLLTCGMLETATKTVTDYRARV